jgi:mRNA interferase YafQ
MLIVHYTSGYKRSFKRYVKSGRFSLDKLTNALTLLREEKMLPYQYQDHQLKGKLAEFRECHIASNVLLVYKIEDKLLKLNSLGSHNELF